MAINNQFSNQFQQNSYPGPQLIYSQPQQNVPNMPGILYQTPNIQPVQTQPQTGMIFVKGEQGAKSYYVLPNSTVTLWDENENTIYLKSADGSGMPSMKILDFTIRESQSQTPNDIPKEEYVTKSSFDALIDRIKELENKIDISFKQRNYNNKKGGD